MVGVTVVKRHGPATQKAKRRPYREGMWQQSRQLLVAVCCLLCLFASAQTVWNRTYIEDRPAIQFTSILKTDSVYNILGVTVNKVAPYYEQSLAAKLNSSGDILSYSALPDTTGINTGSFWNNLIQTSEGGFAFSGYGFDSVQHLLFGRATNSFDSSIKLFRYYTPSTYSFQGASMAQYNANAFYIAGVHNSLPGNNSNIVLVKVDSNGNRLWQKYYNQYKADYAKSVIVLDNGNLLLGAYRRDLNQINEQANTWLLEVDTGGSFVRQWFDTNDSTYAAEGLRQTKDGGFIYGAQKKVTQSFNDVYCTATVVKMNSNFQKQWTFKEGSQSDWTAIVDIEELPDGNFVCCGSKPFYNGDSTMMSGWIVKLSPTGNVIWNKTYAGLKTAMSLNFLKDIDIVEDGSLIAVGQCQNNAQQPSQVGWFLKLDSNGCVVENCYLSLNPSPRERDFNSQMQVWPNPASSSVQLEVSSEMVGGEVKVYDVHGRVVKKFQISSLKLVVDVSDWSKGMYVITTEKDERVARGKLVVE